MKTFDPHEWMMQRVGQIFNAFKEGAEVVNLVIDGKVVSSIRRDAVGKICSCGRLTGCSRSICDTCRYRANFPEDRSVR